MTKKINIFLSTLTVVLCLFGYQFVTSIFSFIMPVGVEGVSRLVTVPFRATQLGLSLIVIFLNIKERFNIKPVLKVLILYWILIFIRFFIDMYARTDVFVFADKRTKTLLLMIDIIIPMFALMKSYKYIDFSMLFNLSYLFLSVAIIITYFTNEAFQTASMERLDANFALNTISTGHTGLSGLILSIYILFNRKLDTIKKLIVIAIAILSFFVWLRAGSRGPILACIFILAVFIFAKCKNNVTGTIIMLFTLTIGYLSLDFLMSLMEQVTPMLYARFNDFEERGGQTESRDFLYIFAINTFLEHPLMGKNFAIYGDVIGQYGQMIYSHNVFLDSLMQWGIIGAGLFAYLFYKSVAKFVFLIRSNSTYKWIGFILIQYLMLIMVSGAFYLQSEITLCMVLLFMQENNYNYSICNISQKKMV